MRKRTCVTIAALILGMWLCPWLTDAQAPDTAARTDTIRSFAGVWKAEEYRVPAASELDVSVWGKGASRVRNVELALEPDGDGWLKVYNSVVDARGRTKRYSASVVEASLELRPPRHVVDGVYEPEVVVKKAEERYLDGSGDVLPVQGLTVKLHAIAPATDRLEMRYDTLRGTGSFGETLRRQAAGSASVRRSPVKRR